jgi:sulfoacetaldehyde acetyltransferase
VCDDEIYATPLIGRGPGDLDALTQAAELLCRAKFPVILAGGGVSQADALAQVKALAEYLTAPVVNSYLHNDTFPSDHALAVGPIGYCGSKAAMRTIAKADVVLALGSRLGPFGTLPQYDMAYWPQQAKVIQVDVNLAVLGLSKRVDVASCGDVKAFSAALLERIRTLQPGLQANAPRLQEVAAARRTWADELHRWSSAGGTPMHPRRFLAELARAIPADSIITTDIGNNSSMCNAYFKFTDVRRHLSALSWGNCGFAYGAAMGAKIGAPDKPVFAFQGDGAYGISGIQEVMTAVREKIPVIAIVANNREWGAEKKNQIDYYNNRFIGADLRENPDYARLAQEMGAEGIRVTAPDQVGDAVREAAACGRPCVIDAMIQGGAEVLAEPFRRDALKMPVRYLEKYKHLMIP